jgi:hypothetical protein
MFSQLVRQSRRVAESIPISLDRGLGNDRAIAGVNAPPLNPGCAPAVVTMAITPCVFSSSTYTPGRGAVAFYSYDVDSGLTTASACTDDFASVNVLNWSRDPITVQVGTSVWVTWWSNYWWLLQQGASSGAVLFCNPSGLAGATGTWPSLTPGSISTTVYRASGSTLATIGTQTVYNWFPAAPASGKILEVFPDGAGDFVAGPQSC